jgi:hypothetical protein
VFLYYQHRTSGLPKPPQQIPRYMTSGHRLQIVGFRYEGNREGKKTISIKADKFTIEKKKLGLFRVGLLNVARFKNAVIDIYGQRIGTGQDALPMSTAQAPGKPNTHTQNSGMSFRELFTGDALPSFSVKRISSIMIEPICLNLYDGESLISQITASSANIRLRKRDIFFEGNVLVKSGSASLKSDHLILMPENGALRAERHFFLETPEKRLEGERLTTDLYLRN